MKRHFVTLDGCRGIAAITVAVAHAAQWVGAPVPPFAFLSLDFFFMLSGFVVSLAYEDRLRGPMSAAAFLRVRVLRLHPMLMFGALLGGLEVLATALHRHTPIDLSHLAVLLAMTIFLVPFHERPQGGFDGHDLAFPLNGPMWSMFSEYSINIFYGLIAKRLNNRVLAAIIAASAISLVGISYSLGTLGFGFSQSDILLALVRVCCPFFVGVALCRLYRAGAFSHLKVPLVTPCVLILIVVGMPGFVPAVPYALFAGFVLLPLVMISGIVADPERDRRSGIMAALGRLSYPLYVVHAPVILGLASFGHHLPDDGKMALALALVALVALAAIVAWFAERWYDEPLRHRLRRSRNEKEPSSIDRVPVADARPGDH